jgi:predicted HAD superfamily phosphohydrolase
MGKEAVVPGMLVVSEQAAEETLTAAVVTAAVVTVQDVAAVKESAVVMVIESISTMASLDSMTHVVMSSAIHEYSAHVRNSACISLISILMMCRTM